MGRADPESEVINAIIQHLIWSHQKKKKKATTTVFSTVRFSVLTYSGFQWNTRIFFRENVACWRCLHSQYLPQYLTFKSHSTHICSMTENFYHKDTESSLEVSGTNIPEKEEKLEGKKLCFSNICWTETWELQETKSLEYQNNNKIE